jgi:isopenicillin N synthase-like dioxygenase
MGLDDEEYFVKNHSFMEDPKIRTQSQFRTLHYYEMEPNDPSIPPNAIRCGEHSDWGTITMLFQNLVGGLEVRRVDGTWIDAIPIKGSILINAGQLLELESAGIFKASVIQYKSIVVRE